MGGVWSGVLPLALAGGLAVALVRTQRLRRERPGLAIVQRIGLVLLTAPLLALLLLGAFSLPNVFQGTTAHALSTADLTGKALLHGVGYLATPALGLALVLGPRRAARAFLDRLSPPGPRRVSLARALSASGWASGGLVLAAVAAWSLAQGSGGLLSAGGAHVVFANATPAVAVALAASAALAEEGLFRGLLLDTLDRRVRTATAIVVQGVLFGLIHAGYGSLPHVLGATVFGILMGKLAVDRGLLPAISAHFLVNLALLGLWTSSLTLLVVAGLAAPAMGLAAVLVRGSSRSRRAAAV